MVMVHEPKKNFYRRRTAQKVTLRVPNEGETSSVTPVFLKGPAIFIQFYSVLLNMFIQKRCFLMGSRMF